MKAVERARLLVDKYSLDYLKLVINGMIKQYRSNNDQKEVEYWIEVANEIKKIKSVLN